jgi:hypothetical protein
MKKCFALFQGGYVVYFLAKENEKSEILLFPTRLLTSEDECKWF